VLLPGTTQYDTRPRNHKGVGARLDPPIAGRLISALVCGVSRIAGISSSKNHHAELFNSWWDSHPLGYAVVEMATQHRLLGPSLALPTPPHRRADFGLRPQVRSGILPPTHAHKNKQERDERVGPLTFSSQAPPCPPHHRAAVT